MEMNFNNNNNSLRAAKLERTPKDHGVQPMLRKLRGDSNSQPLAPNASTTELIRWLTDLLWRGSDAPPSLVFLILTIGSCLEFQVELFPSLGGPWLFPVQVLTLLVFQTEPRSEGVWAEFIKLKSL